MQIVETIKYTLSAHANDFQYFQTVVLWLLPSAFCLQMADSHPVRVSVSNEQGARSEVHCGSQHEGMEGNASKGSFLSSTCQQNCLHSCALKQINVLRSEPTCFENNLVKNNLVKDDEFSDPSHSVTPQAVALVQPRGLHTAVCFMWVMPSKYLLVLSVNVVEENRSSYWAIFVAHMGTI